MFGFFKKKKKAPETGVDKGSITAGGEPPHDDPGAPGWDAIDAKLAEFYAGREPDLHLTTLIGYRLGGPDPLDGISAFIRQEPSPHIHYISYGFSELYEKESEVAEHSGYGFELTFRLAVDPDNMPKSQEDVPQWPGLLMQHLARYVFETGKVFIHGQFMHLQQPINGQDENPSPTEIQGSLFIQDPELGEIDTPHGKVEFLQMIGATESELEALMAKTFVGRDLAETLSAEDPLLITDMARSGNAKG